MNLSSEILDKRAQHMGYAGLLPPAVFVAAVLVDPSLRWIMLAAGFGYAAFIFSFLGGIWWGLAMGRPHLPSWIWIAAVAPSLICLALFMPWTFGWKWPIPAMRILGALILFSPFVDRAIVYSTSISSDWMRLRIGLSIGLAALIIALSML
ncbi:DUF3429 domain-containing protein [Novosphingobium sp. P6W]|uniref:DUF3429 domain-containing protein n=1 Tax=Novosphingobium sp. P6W TaxID=1609758 RepID=UPI0006988D91|nr:DUF3429 domain-containing protein [Novosphingobium sp. P6W]